MSDIFGGPPEDEGFEGGFDPFGYPEDYAEVEDPYGFWHGEEPEDWWYQELTIEPYRMPDEPPAPSYTMEIHEWYEATLNPNEVNQMLYGMNTHDIIEWLVNEDIWDRDDWEVWKEYYGE